MVGAVWLMLLDYNVSIAAWVGMIAHGLDAETGVFMLLFLDLAYDDAGNDRRARSPASTRRSCTARCAACGPS